MPAWKKSGHIVLSNVAGLEDLAKQDMSYILLDLRSKDLVEKGHIAKAVGLPEKGLDALEDQLPKFKGAAIILYNQDGNTASAMEAYKKITGWGYKQVSLLQGGLQGWEKAGKELAKGPAASKITYVRKLAPGEVELTVFQAQIQKPGPDKIILDVRNASEFAEGSLPNSMNIPLDDLEQRLAELPKDKTILMCCGTGARAEMGYNILKNAGLNAKFLKAKIDYDKEDKKKYTIED